MQFEQRTQDGYSLIELMIVMGVIAVIATILVTSISNALDRSRQKATMADMRTLSRAIEAYAVDNKGIPDDLGGMQALRQHIESYTNNRAVPTRDKWGHYFRYVRSGQEYSLESFGKDGLNGVDHASNGSKDFTHDIVMVNGLFVAAPE